MNADDPDRPDLGEGDGAAGDGPGGRLPGPGQVPGHAAQVPGQVPGQGWPPGMEQPAGPDAAGAPRVPGQAPAGFGGVTSAAAAPEAPAAGAVPAVPAPADPVDGEIPPSDAELTAMVRAGDDGAYEELYRRHADAVRRYARTCCRDNFTAEDLAGEVFARTLQALRAGRGPDLAVRAYLLTAVRNVAAAWTRSERREQLVEDFTAFTSSSAAKERLDITDPGADVWVMAKSDRRMVLRAFVALPEDDRMVLWHTEVERETPKQVAVLLGKTANATAVQAHRARDRLATAFLQAHVSSVQDDSCRRHADRLGAYARGALRKRASAEVGAHLKECDRCSAAYLELVDLSTGLRAVLPGGVLVWVGAGYFTAAATVAGGAAVAGGAVAGGTATGSTASGAAAGGAAAGSAGGSGGGSAAVAGEGVGAAVKAAVAVTVTMAAAAAVVVYALSGGTSPTPPARAVPRPAVSQAMPSPEPPRTGPSPGPDPGHPSTPAPVRTPAPAPDRTTTAHSAPPPPPPAATPSRTAARPTEPPRPSPSVPPTAAPTPTPTPPPTTPTPPSPPEVDYWLNQLRYGGFGPGDAPTVQGSVSDWFWPRHHLRIGGVGHTHGITVRAPSTVVIALNRPCSAFDAVAGVDDMTHGLGTVVFTVADRDGGTLWTSAPVHGGDAALPVHVPLAGLRAVRLTVRPAGHDGPGRRLADLADWADARLSC
ncbi:sigma-70 family RNA polymerase sigma factor [Peterkaempfera sp. SMS 1(5)a]|uniref:sigma-70 family RNA polymerase sigma factor n=1 Tax=Peterkaempfera podocarpi TaxID=3232308 RepID=UPI00366F3D18